MEEQQAVSLHTQRVVVYHDPEKGLCVYTTVYKIGQLHDALQACSKRYPKARCYSMSADEAMRQIQK